MSAHFTYEDLLLFSGAAINVVAYWLMFCRKG